LGKKLGLLTLVADTGKAIIPMLLTRWCLHTFPLPVSIDVWVALSGASAFLGHLYPIYLKFKGGKGVATALGVFLLLEPWAVLISLGIFAGVVSASGYVSLGSITAAALIPIWVWLFGHSALNTALALFIALFIWIKHYSNIVRLIKGEEKSWKKG
jgi:glycerol-3-phosphate acyltransferase PlsY